MRKILLAVLLCGLTVPGLAQAFDNIVLPDCKEDTRPQWSNEHRKFYCRPLPWDVNDQHQHEWEQSKYSLLELGVSFSEFTLGMLTVTNNGATYPMQPLGNVDVCKVCNLLRLHPKPKDVVISNGQGVSDGLKLTIAGDGVSPDGPTVLMGGRSLLNQTLGGSVTIGSNWSDTQGQPSIVLEVEDGDGNILGSIREDGSVGVNPCVKYFCQEARFKRNMQAALKGSAKATRYLHTCARRSARGGRK